MPSNGEDDNGDTTALTAGWIVCCAASVTFQLFRMSLDIIQTASIATSEDFKEDHHNAMHQNNTTRLRTSTKYGSINQQHDTETEALIAPTILPPSILEEFFSPSNNRISNWSFRLQLALTFLLFGEAIVFPAEAGILPIKLVFAAFVVVFLGCILTRLDITRSRFGVPSRVLYLFASFTIWLPTAVYFFRQRLDTSMLDELVINEVGLYGLLSIAETLFIDLPDASGSSDDEPPKRKTLSRAAILTLLKPYFWPDATSDSASLNRIRAMLTWACVILSKVCNLVAPLFLGWASTALAHESYQDCTWYSIAYATIQFFGSTFKEGQSLIYLKVAQAAFVQLSETTFTHLHTLSLDWHLRKKLGEVIRSMDRGIAACDTLMKYLFLWLVPAIAECLVVCIIFATYFQYLPLAVAIFYFVFVYIVWTILVTLWRKKFRKAVVQSDNEWHDRCTDSLINFETVKFFTAEEYERKRFKSSVQKYQAGSVNVQASLSFLNISQKFILQLSLATALSMSAMGIKQRIDCCVNDHGCDSGVSECCQNIDNDTCPGMQVGDFVAILTYTIQLFSPLNFLGSVYNAIVMAIIDLTNLSELLAEDPDVTDAPDAIPLPSANEEDEDVAVEFDNVTFHYPTQPSTKGLKGVSFKMKRGTTTAVVGPTGSGKTTISRLFFRFYDVLGGAVKVNGKDVRTLTQKSLRGAIGVVPQAASMFNDTIKANLQYGRLDATDKDLEQAAKDAQLFTFIESLDLGWETMVGDRGLKLSGGEKQRAAIARCLLKNPPFVCKSIFGGAFTLCYHCMGSQHMFLAMFYCITLVLDEATSALDTLTEKSVQEALDRLGNQRTVLVIAHRLGTIRNADNILVLKDGIIAEEGNHDMLLAKNGLYAEMWNMQLHSNASSESSLTALNDS